MNRRNFIKNLFFGTVISIGGIFTLNSMKKSDSNLHRVQFKDLKIGDSIVVKNNNNYNDCDKLVELKIIESGDKFQMNNQPYHQCDILSGKYVRGGKYNNRDSSVTFIVFPDDEIYKLS